MTRVSTVPAILLAAAVLTPAVRAAGDTGVYLKVYSGVGITDDSDLRIRQADIGNDYVLSEVSWDDNSLNGPSAPYLGVRLGYFLKRTPWLGFAGDFLHFKVFSETERTVRIHGTRHDEPIDQSIEMRQVVQRYEVANGINMITGQLFGRLRLVKSSARRRCGLATA